MIWRQKSREKWLKEGDRSTKYFHALASYRRRINYIEEIVIDNKKIGGNTALCEAAKGHFANLYLETHDCRPKLDGMSFHSISVESRQSLEDEFTTEEILEGLKSCDDNKASGPNGFSMNFL